MFVSLGQKIVVTRTDVLPKEKKVEKVTNENKQEPKTERFAIDML